MDLRLSEVQHMVRESTADVVRRQIGPAAAAADRTGRLAPEVLATLAELGYFGACVPADSGGAELDAVALGLAIEETARGCASTAALLVAANCLAAEALLRGGSPEQRSRYLPRMAAGEIKAAFALSEATGAEEPYCTGTIARSAGGRFRLSGCKRAAAGIALADLLVVAAAREPAGGDSPPALFLVPRATAGLSVGPAEALLGLRASGAAALTLEEVELGPEALLGEPDQGGRLLAHLADCENLGLAAAAVGIAAAAAAAAVQYSSDRRQFGRPICEFGAIRHMLAESSAEIEAARHLALAAAAEKDAGRPFGLIAAQARLFATQMANRVAQRSLQVHGGYGYTKEYAVERHFRDARLLELWGGGSELQRHRIAGELLARSQKE